MRGPRTLPTSRHIRFQKDNRIIQWSIDIYDYTVEHCQCVSTRLYNFNTEFLDFVTSEYYRRGLPPGGLLPPWRCTVDDTRVCYEWILSTRITTGGALATLGVYYSELHEISDSVTSGYFQRRITTGGAFATLGAYSGL